MLTVDRVLQEISATCIFLATKVHEVHKRISEIIDCFFKLKPIPNRPRPTPQVNTLVPLCLLC